MFSPTLFNTFLERIMTDTLKHHEGIVSVYGRTVTSLRFASDFDGLAGSGSEEELTLLMKCLDKTSAAYGMKISAEKNKLVTNNTNGISTNVKINGEKNWRPFQASDTLDQWHHKKDPSQKYSLGQLRQPH